MTHEADCLCSDIGYRVTTAALWDTICSCKHCLRHARRSYMVEPTFETDGFEAAKGIPTVYDQVSETTKFIFVDDARSRTVIPPGNPMVLWFRLDPAWLSAWEWIGAVLLLVSCLLILFGHFDIGSTTDVIPSLPIAVKEMALAPWLILQCMDLRALSFRSAGS